MNRSFIVESNNKKYVLYIPVGSSTITVDREVEKDCLNKANLLKIAPKNIYFDTKKGIKVNEFLEGVSINSLTSWDYSKVSFLFHRLHDSNFLSAVDYQPFLRLSRFEKEALKYENINDLQNYSVVKNLLLEEKSFLESQTKCLCHNDAQRSNIIFSNENYYFIDFEFSGNNDPIYDIATFGNNDVDEGFTLLKYYFKDNLKNEHIKRYYLWRMFISLQWAVVALLKHHQGEGKIHNIDFSSVKDFFLENAFTSYKKYLAIF